MWALPVEPRAPAFALGASVSICSRRLRLPTLANSTAIELALASDQIYISGIFGDTSLGHGIRTSEVIIPVSRGISTYVADCLPHTIHGMGFLPGFRFLLLFGFLRTPSLPSPRDAHSPVGGALGQVRRPAKRLILENLEPCDEAAMFGDIVVVMFPVLFQTRGGGEGSSREERCSLHPPFLKRFLSI